MISAAAGTFNILHEGHKALLDRAFEIGDEVFIGITSDRMASSSRDKLNTYYIREKAVRDYAASKKRPFSIFRIDDMYGPDEMMDRVDVLVVSEETLGNGEMVVRRASETAENSHPRM